MSCSCDLNHDALNGRIQLGVRIGKHKAWSTAEKLGLEIFIQSRYVGYPCLPSTRQKISAFICVSQYSCNPGILLSLPELMKEPFAPFYWYLQVLFLHFQAGDYGPREPPVSADNAMWEFQMMSIWINFHYADLLWIANVWFVLLHRTILHPLDNLIFVAIFQIGKPFQIVGVSMNCIHSS